MKPPKTVTDTTVFVISPDMNAVVQRDYEGGASLYRLSENNHPSDDSGVLASMFDLIAGCACMACCLLHLGNGI